MSMSKLYAISALIMVSILITVGAFCLEYFVLSAPADNYAPSPGKTLLLSIAAPHQEALVLDETEVDLGVAKGVVSHRFIYRNGTTAPLTITNVRSSCRCVVSQSDRTILQPKESGSITLEANVSQKEPGAHRFLVFIEYEWGDRKATATAAMRVVYQPDLYVTPSHVNITVTEGTRATAKITVVDYRKESLKVLKIRPTSTAIETKIGEAPSEYLPGWHHVIDAVYLDPPRETRHLFQERILIETSDPKLPLLTIPVEVHRLERLRIAPQAVTLQPGRRVEVILRDSLGQKIVIAECDSAGLVEPSFTREEESAKKISLSLPRTNTDASKYPATIWIRVSKPCERRLPIRVSLAAPKVS